MTTYYESECISSISEASYRATLKEMNIMKRLQDDIKIKTICKRPVDYYAISREWIDGYIYDKQEFPPKYRPRT